MISLSRRDEILRATLDLAADQGLRSVTLAQIAARVGIKTPSLYNHFKSKDAIMQAAYGYLREQARGRSGSPDAAFIASFEDRSLENLLLLSLEGYASFVLDDEMLRFMRVLYAERSTNPIAAQIMVDETERMVRSVKSFFYALVAHGKMQVDDVDAAAVSYAMTVHSLIDYRLDRLMAEGHSAPLEHGLEAFPEVRSYVAWFARWMEPEHA